VPVARKVGMMVRPSVTIIVAIVLSMPSAVIATNVSFLMRIVFYGIVLGVGS
jgi:hypothetical protein